MSCNKLGCYHESHVKAEQKPCPFCGNTLPEEFAVRIDVDKKFFTEANYTLTDHYSFCCSCGAQGPDGYTKEEAVEKWNKRKE